MSLPFDFTLDRPTAEGKQDQYDGNSSDGDAELCRTRLKYENEQLDGNTSEAEKVEFE